MFAWLVVPPADRLFWCPSGVLPPLLDRPGGDGWLWTSSAVIEPLALSADLGRG